MFDVLWQHDRLYYRDPSGIDGAYRELPAEQLTTWLAAELGSRGPSPLTAVGDIIYGGTAGAETRLAGNSTAVKQVLTQVGSGTASAAPAWGTLDATDVGASPDDHDHDETYQPAYAAQAHQADPTGGTTVDAEARAAINWILDILEAIGAMLGAE